MNCAHNFLGESTCEHCGADEGTFLRNRWDAALERARRLETGLRAIQDLAEDERLLFIAVRCAEVLDDAERVE